jgi:hypothetical protein
MMMRLHLEPSLGELFGLCSDYKEGIMIFMKDYLRNGLI